MTILAALLLAIAGQSRLHPFPADSSRSTSAAQRWSGAEVFGRIPDKETGEPRSSGSSACNPRTDESNFMAHTDDAGLYRFAGLLPDEYSEFAEADEFRGTHRTTPISGVPGIRAALKPGERREANLAATGFAAMVATSGRARQDGTFRIAPLRAGEYRVAAIHGQTPVLQEWQTDRIAQIAAAGERVVLGDLDDRLVDVRVLTARRTGCGSAWASWAPRSLRCCHGN